MALTVTQAQPNQTISGVTQAQPGTISGVTQVQPGTISGVTQANPGTISGVSQYPVGTGTVNPQQTAPATALQPAATATTVQPGDNNPQATADANALYLANNPMSFAPNSQINTGQGVPPATAVPAGMSLGTTPPSPTEQAFNQMKNTPAPQDSAQVGTQVQDQINKNTPPLPPDTTKIDAITADDKAHQQYIADFNAAQSSAAQTETLTAEYTRLIAAANIPALNTQLLNMKNIIDGTEQDIRNEVTKAGGFATNSQVLALSNARNKTMIQNYNNLLQTRDDLMKNIDTMMGLSKEDKAIAKQQVDEKLNFDQKQIEFADKAVANANTIYDKIAAKDGYAGLYAAAQGDAYSLSLMEQSLGLHPGGLAALAQVETAAAAAKAATTSQPTSVKEYEYAKSQGYTGSYNDYQNMDANRKAVRQTTNNTTLTYNQAKDTAQTQASTVIGGTLAKLAGKDGYVSPQDFKAGLAKWTSAGYAAKDYYSQFSNYINPQSYGTGGSQDYGKY